MPIVVKSENQGDPHCVKCGHWWMPQYGSIDPGAAPPLEHLLAEIEAQQKKAKERAIMGKRSNKTFRPLRLGKGRLKR